MHAYAEAGKGRDEVVQSVSAQMGWSHSRALLDPLENQDLREWYGAQAVHHGWSVAVLEHQISSKLHEREGSAANNLLARLPGEGSDLRGLSAEAHQAAIEEAVTVRTARMLMEFGSGFDFFADRCILRSAWTTSTSECCFITYRLIAAWLWSSKRASSTPSALGS